MKKTIVCIKNASDDEIHTFADVFKNSDNVYLSQEVKVFQVEENDVYEIVTEKKLLKTIEKCKADQRMEKIKNVIAPDFKEFDKVNLDENTN